MAFFSHQNCTVTYESLECLPINITGNACNFEYNFDRFRDASAWILYPNIDGADVISFLTPIDSNPYIDYNGVCNYKRIINDVTSTTPLQVLPGYTFESNVFEIQMDGVQDDTSITPIISHVSVEAIDAEGTLFKQIFTVEDKQRLMQTDLTSYFYDAHYCRYINRAHATDPGTCDLPFYNKLKTNGMNELTNSFALIDPSKTIVQNYTIDQSPFLITNHGFEACQDVRTRNMDRFIFNPSMWIFKNMKRNGPITGTVNIIAELSDCYTSPNRRVLNHRMLSNQSISVISYNTTFILNLDDYYANLIRKTNTNNIALIVGLSVLSLCILSAATVVFCKYVKRSNKQQALETPNI